MFYLLYFFIISLFINVFSYILGRLLFKLGFKKIGHYFVALSIAGDFGLFKKTRKWLVDNCQNVRKKNCRLWTCGNYEKCSKNK